jgi:hypothetical protein
MIQAKRTIGLSIIYNYFWLFLKGRGPIIWTFRLLTYINGYSKNNESHAVYTQRLKSNNILLILFSNWS